MLPRLEKEMRASDEISSKLPVGMKQSRPGKASSGSSASSWGLAGCSPWTTIAGRLGVLRRLLGEGGSLVVVPLDDVRAESLRSSSPGGGVRLRAEARGPGEVRGRRRLSSHDREGGPVAENALSGLESTGASAFEASHGSSAAWPEGLTASSLMMRDAGRRGHGESLRARVVAGKAK